METETARDDALDYLSAVQALHASLDGVHKELHDLRDSGRRPSREDQVARKIGQANKAIEHGLQLAQIHALLYIGDRLEALETLHGLRGMSLPIGLIPGVKGRPLDPDQLAAEFEAFEAVQKAVGDRG